MPALAFYTLGAVEAGAAAITLAKVTGALSKAPNIWHSYLDALGVIGSAALVQVGCLVSVWLAFFLAGLNSPLSNFMACLQLQLVKAVVVCIILLCGGGDARCLEVREVSHGCRMAGERGEEDEDLLEMD